MADISDIETYLYNTAQSAVYPNGTSQPSVAGMDVRIMEGWPLPDQLDLDMAGKMLSGNPPVPVSRPNGPLASVSIFPMVGNTATPYQIQDKTYVISQPTYGLSIVSAVNGVITVSGAPANGEYLTVITDRNHAYSHVGASRAAVLSALAADFSANYSGVSSTDTTLTIPGTYAMVIRQGGVGVLGKVVHRQRQAIMVTVWAPTHVVRTALAKAVDVALKSQVVVTLPDTSQALICYNRTNVIDEKQMVTIYRRDLIYDAEFSTVQQFPGYVVTSVNTSVANYNNSSIVPAIT